MIEEDSMNDDNYESYLEDELGVEEEELRNDDKFVKNWEDEEGSQVGSSTQQDAEPANSVEDMSGQKIKQRWRLLKDLVHTYFLSSSCMHICIYPYFIISYLIVYALNC